MAETRRRPIGGPRCPLRHCGGVLEDLVRPGGAVVTRCPRCDRRRAGVCRDCPQPVAGTVGKALRCAPCARAAKRAAGQKYRADPGNRRRKNAATRKRWRRDAAMRARTRERRRAWASSHPEQRRRHVRRYRLKRTPGYVAGYQRHNADPVRQEKKRQQARAKYYARHPTRPAPVCASCGEAIAYDGKGRPPKYHPEHSPWKRQLKGHRNGPLTDARQEHAA